jgi:small-conductance mechanosensitive channel
MDVGGKGDRMEAAEIQEMQEQMEALKTQLADAKKGGDGNSDELERLKAERAELIAGRDKAKEKARLAEETKLAENGEFKTLAEQKTAEADKLQQQLEELNGTVNGYVERDEAKFKTLLEKVPESLRETLDDSIPLAKRLELAEKLIAEKPDGPGSRRAGELESNQITRSDFDAKSAAEKSSFIIGGGTVKD